MIPLKRYKRVGIVLFFCTIAMVCGYLWFQYKETSKKKTINFVADENYPPFEFRNDKGEPDGFVVDLIKEVMKKTSYNYTITMVPFEDIEKYVLNTPGEIYVSSCMVYLERRLPKYNFSLPYSLRYSCIASNKNSGIESLRDIKGKKISAPINGQAMRFLEMEGINCESVGFKSMKDALVKVNSGESDCTIGEMNQIRYFLTTEKLNNINLYITPWPPVEHCFAFSKKDQAALDEINEAIYKIKASGVYNRIHDEWFGGYYVEKTPHLFLYLSIIGSFLVLIIIIGFHFLLRKKARTVLKDKDQTNKKIKQTAAELRSLYQQYDTVFDSLPVGVVILDKETNIVEVNDEFLKLFGFKNKNPLLKMNYDVYENSDILESYKELFTTKEDFEVIKEYRVEDKIKSIDVICRAVRDEEGEVQNYVVILQDITKLQNGRKEVEDLQKLFNYAIKTANITVWQFDVESRNSISYNDPLNKYNPEVETSIGDFLKSVNKKDRKRAFKDLYGRMLKGENKELSVSISKKSAYDNDYKYCTIFSSPLKKDEIGQITQYVGIIQDNTRFFNITQELERKNIQLNMALSAGNLISLTWNLCSDTFHITSSDTDNDFDVFKDVTGGISREALLCNIVTKDRNRLNRKLERLRKRLCTNISDSVKYEFDGKEDKYYEFNFILFDSGALKQKVAVGYMQDVTLRRKMIELKDAKDKAEISDRMKSAFITNMSHEIRTPLNSIVGFSQLINETDDQEERKEFLSIIHKNNEVLLHLINEILDLSKIESGFINLNLQSFSINEVMEEIYENTVCKNHNAKIEIIKEISFVNYSVVYDRVRLEQVVNSFIDNSLKYTFLGHIKIGYKLHNNGILIYVRDTGIGISKENHDRVFQPFEKLDNFSQSIGLSLSICKSIATISNGDIGFFSEEGIGSEFWFWFPTKISVISTTEVNDI